MIVGISQVNCCDHRVEWQQAVMLRMKHIDRYWEQERHILCVRLDSKIYLDLVTVICTLALSIAIGQLSLFLGCGHQNAQLQISCVYLARYKNTLPHSWQRNLPLTEHWPVYYVYIRVQAGSKI